MADADCMVLAARLVVTEQGIGRKLYSCNGGLTQVTLMPASVLDRSHTFEHALHTQLCNTPVISTPGHVQDPAHGKCQAAKRLQSSRNHVQAG